MSCYGNMGARSPFEGVTRTAAPPEPAAPETRPLTEADVLRLFEEAWRLPTGPVRFVPPHALDEADRP